MFHTPSLRGGVENGEFEITLAQRGSAHLAQHEATSQLMKFSSHVYQQASKAALESNSALLQLSRSS